MKGYTYIDDGKFDFTDKAKPGFKALKTQLYVSL